MANHKFSTDIINDALFRADEPITGNSDYESQALIHLNRAYRALYMGGTEFDPNINETWWWMKATGTLLLNPPIDNGTISVTRDSDAVTFSTAPQINSTNVSVAGWYLKITDHPDVFKISAHTSGNTTATLDQNYTGPTDTTANYRLSDLEYDLASDLIKVVAPMRVYRANANFQKIDGMAESEFADHWPLHRINRGIPTHFCQVDEDTVRFNRSGDIDGEYTRVDYSYIARPSDLTDSPSEEPLVPQQYRYILSDMLAFFILLDKEDDKAEGIGLQARNGLRAMARENAQRWQQTGEPGQIYPRAAERFRGTQGPLRTESGHIIG